MRTATSPYLVEVRLGQLRERRKVVDNLIRALDRYQQTRSPEKKTVRAAKTHTGEPAWGVGRMAS